MKLIAGLLLPPFVALLSAVCVASSLCTTIIVVLAIGHLLGTWVLSWHLALVAFGIVGGAGVSHFNDARAIPWPLLSMEDQSKLVLR